MIKSLHTEPMQSCPKANYAVVLFGTRSWDRGIALDV